MVHSNRESSNAVSDQFNSSQDGANPSLDEVFEELERWNEAFKPHADELRGPRP